METKRAAKPVKSASKTAFDWYVSFLKDYLKDVKPAANASEEAKKRYDQARLCLREMEKTVLGWRFDTTKATMIRPCLGFWPIIPPQSESLPRLRRR